MTFEEFEILVAHHGTDPSGWPDPSLALHPDVADWLSAERVLDAQLMSVSAPLSANFADRVVDSLPSRRNTRPLWFGAIAASLVAALFGVALFSQSPATPDTEAELWMEFAEDVGFGELWEWTEG